MILDNLAIQVDLVSANEAYSVSLGKSASELTEAEQKSALMAQVLEKLQENTAALPDVTGNASTSMAQLKTSLENAKNGIGEAMLPALTALLGPLAELAQQYGPAVVEWAQQAGVWLGENIPIALERASEFWNKTLKPALTNLWEFTRDDVIPIVKTIAAWLGENVPIAMEAISNFWNETLKPAFQAIIDLWNEDLKPAAQTLATMFSETLKGAWDTLTGAFDWAKTHVLDPVRDAFDRIKNAVQGVIDFIGGLIDKLGNLNLPDWLTPGSPTPFEIGLRGISDALRSMPDLSATFTLQPVAAPALAAHGGAGGRYFGGGLVINQYFGRDSVRSDDDIERIAQRIEDVLALRGAREF
jgi:phage-related protein